LRCWLGCSSGGVSLAGLGRARVRWKGVVDAGGSRKTPRRADNGASGGREREREKMRKRERKREKRSGRRACRGDSWCSLGSGSGDYRTDKHRGYTFFTGKGWEIISMCLESARYPLNRLCYWGVWPGFGWFCGVAGGVAGGPFCGRMRKDAARGVLGGVRVVVCCDVWLVGRCCCWWSG